MNSRKRLLLTTTLISSLVLIPKLYANEVKDTKPLAPPNAHAEMKAASGSKVSGTIDITESNAGIKIQYKLSGLNKNGKHGFHIHENGDCSSADAKSAGGHYHKLDESGGTSSNNPARYAGDMPEIKADKKGNAKGSFIVSGLSIDKNIPVLNHAIIIHGAPDDISKPSAPRIACGVITTATK